MKYESEIIAEILEKRGHEMSSLHYESECIETWIEETKGAYPKLCDYESEWINYINENPIGEFPYETITNVTEATINNVVPYAYKSAILKGQTLVNLSEINYFSLSGSGSSLSTSISNKFKTNTDYTRLVFITKNTLTGVNEKGCVAQPHIGGKTQTVFFVSDDNAIAENFTGLLQKTKFTTPSNISTYQQMSGIRIYSVNTGGVLEGYEIILEGDYTNQDIPYFEGMQSVKMPVLTTTGKNLFNKDDFYNDWKGKDTTYVYNENIDGEEVLKINNLHSLYDDNRGFKIFVEKDVPLTLTIKCKKAGTNSTNSVFLIRHGDSSSVSIGGCVSNEWVERIVTFTPTRDYITICSAYNVNDYFYIKDIQLEVGSVKTPYEPYKTNILTVNEPVELRGIGEVQDTLDCLTGEVTERIGEIVLDGSHNIVIGSDNIESYETMEFFIEDVYKNGMINHKQISDKLPYDFSNDDYEHFYVTDERVIVFVKKSKLATQDTNGFKQYLSQNPLIVQYQLATESFKTVELTITNQDGETLTKLIPFEGTMHLSTDGQDIKPTFSGEIPVEAITQNLSSFIVEE